MLNRYGEISLFPVFPLLLVRVAAKSFSILFGMQLERFDLFLEWSTMWNHVCIYPHTTTILSHTIPYHTTAILTNISYHIIAYHGHLPQVTPYNPHTPDIIYPHDIHVPRYIQIAYTSQTEYRIQIGNMSNTSKITTAYTTQVPVGYHSDTSLDTI